MRIDWHAKAVLISDIITAIHRLYIINAWWRIHVSLNRVITGWVNGLSPVGRETITWTNADLVLMVSPFMLR